MLGALKAEIAAELRRVVAERFSVEHTPLLETPPRRDLGDLAAPAALHLARVLGRKPREIAAEITDALALPEGVERVTIEGPGYLNFHLRRGALAAGALERPLVERLDDTPPKTIVEHTNINPNKAAHVGHLRNAVLGDTLVAALRVLGYPVEVQNYIDDTGVQLADVVVGFADLRGLTADQVEGLPEPFDYYCWDLYSEVGRWFEEDPGRETLRRETLHALEADEGERARVGRVVARRIVHRHLATMRRLGVGYDLLARESEILRLDFFARAFERLRACGAVRLEPAGRNAGCWVMPLADTEEFEGLEEPDKVVVRSDGTVTYVGKDIAYQLWKFGLLSLDFEYRWWDEEGVWETAPPRASSEAAPAFGGAGRVVNVIDARQSYLQKIVAAGLHALGHVEEARQSIHFAYEMVALSPAAARQLGLDAGEEEVERAGEQGDAGARLTSGTAKEEPAGAGGAPGATSGAGGRATLMSGRKGIGVKADDLLDRLEAKAREGIAERNRELAPAELDRLARQIATAALRFLMVKATTTRVIAFDFDEALAFEGETGPYLQYSLVREANIRRKLEAAGLPTSVTPGEVDALPAAVWSDDLWDLVLSVAQIEETVRRAADTLELSLLARHAIDVARKFHAIYHRHPILHEQDAALRQVRLATNAVFRRGLESLMAILGIPVPERM
ncbi:MAG TPA: arginine--tRNA ligase [Thermoanaerobaculia bacterium]|nr:arginine--tRNA ligase [Thermoanaerobaculia bacterium]